MATFGGGIACYDGLKFNVINEDAGLSKDLVRSISFDESGEKMYVGAQGAFNLITKDSIFNLDNVLNDTIVSNVLLVSVKGNTVYAATQDGFITLVNQKKTDVIKRINANSYLFDEEKNLWLGTRTGLFIKTASGKLIDYKLQYNIAIDGVSDIKRYNGYTIVAARSGLHVFQKFKLVQVINRQNGLTQDFIRCLLVEKNTLWIGTKTGLVNTTDLKTFTTFDSKNGIDKCEIKCMALDNNGFLWVGSSTNGIFKTIKNDIVKYSIGSQPLSFGMDNKKNVYALIKNQVKIFNSDSNKFLKYRDVIGVDNLKQICFDKNNAIYITAGDKGIVKINPSNARTFYEAKMGSSDNPAMSLMSDDTCVWMGFKRRLLRYNLITGKVDSIKPKQVGASFFQDITKSGNTVWFATDHGLSRFDGRKFDGFSDYTVKNFPDGIVNTITADKYGHIWLAADRGLFCLEDKNIYTNYRKDGFPTNEISEVAVLDTFLFAATNKGLVQLNIKRNENTNSSYRTLNKTNGLTDFDLTNKAIFADSTYVWIAYEYGAYRYKPSQFSKTDLPVYIENISNNDGSLIYKNSDNFLNQLVDLNKNLELNYRENDFTIDFIAINYNQLDNVYYSHRLTGLTENWSNPSTETKAVYTNLSPGEYIFEVSASNGKTNFGNVVSYKIIIHPPFYSTWWFNTIVVILSLLAVYGLVQLRIKSIKEQNAILETKVNDRTIELKSKSNELKKTNGELLNKSKLINDSLDYAKKIQESILPSQKYRDKQFHSIVKTAALYIPKDIVSGDFYYTYHKKDFNYFALVDCTGHGVPGAMLSFSVNSILHGIVDNLSSYNEPSKIIQKLTDSFSEIYIKGQDVKESFAISLLAYLPDHKKIFFSGISQSISLLSDNTLVEIKSKTSFLNNVKVDLQNQKFSVKSGDRIYFYSDGFYDQKNKTTGRRLYKSGLYAQIITTGNLPIAKQIAALKEYFNNFKGDKEQIDDVTLFIIEIE